jgi:hypothetical protein
MAQEGQRARNIIKSINLSVLGPSAVKPKILAAGDNDWRRAQDLFTPLMG